MMEWIFLSGYLLVFLAGSALAWINLAHQKRCSRSVPPELVGRFDEDLLKRSLAYSSAKTRLATIQSLTETALLVLFVFGPWLPLYDRLTLQAADSFVIHGTLFFLGLLFVDQLLAIPFGLYRTFILETRYGFNRSTPALWWMDRLKTILLSLLLTGLLAAGCFWLVQASPEGWWLWVWLFAVFFSLFVLVLSPHLIEPLFNRFNPLERPELEQAIETMAAKVGVRTERIFQVDASRRSGHANAYFTGLGRQKRVVLFDTLLEQMDAEEIVAVLAHELGHWRHNHLVKHLLSTAAFTLGASGLAFYLLNRGGLPGLVGLETASFPAQVLILSLLASIVGFFLTPLSSWLSRRHEWQADRFASDLTGQPRRLASALIRLARNNLANLCPHPFYAWFYYSHPPLIERVRALRTDPKNP
ncbi:MAG: M48 family metallopeptidase [Syntrophotaleaceae bacterium]